MNKFIGRGWMMALWLLTCSVAPARAQSGTLDLSFKPGFDNTVFSILVQPDGKLLVSGFFTKAGGGGATTRNGIARLNTDASLDTTFNPGAGSFDTNFNQHATVATMALQRDGKVVIGGYFNLFDGVPRNAIARLNTNGSLDTAFNPIVNDLVVALAVQPDGRLLIGGEFTTVNGTFRNHVARLNTNGTLDTTFDPGSGADASVQAFALQTNGAVIIGGQFGTVNGAPRTRVARLKDNGSLDNSYDVGVGPNDNVLALSLQPDGKVIIGGDFTTIGSDTRRYVARLNTDGSLDASFQPNIALVFGGVLAVQTEVDGKVYVAGYFTTVNGMPRKDLARLNANGSLDTTFVVPSGATGAQDLGLYGITLQADGNVLVGGNFTRFNGTTVNYLARLVADQGGTVEFTSANYSADEGGTATIAVGRTGSTNGAVTVNYLTIDGTAIAGADYVAQAGALLFEPGETTKVFTVPILPDAVLEPNETVTVALGNPIGGVILGANQTATLTIINNTNAPSNTAPVLPTQANRTIDEMITMIVTNTATDADVPANLLTYLLLTGPANATISASGIITWTPTEAQGPSSGVVFTMKVTDNGTPPLSATNSFTVTVDEVNSAPTLPSITSQTVNELTTLTVTNTATDTDLPANTLSYELLAGPANATISASGIITWTPTEAQGPNSGVVFTTKVTDSGAPALSATNTFTVTVDEVNSAPSLPSITSQTVNELTTLTVTNTATDTDLPANTLSYELLAGPTNATISASGIITWTPTEAQGPSSGVVFTTKVIDNGTPALSATNTFTVTVDEVNSAPSLPSITSQTVNELTTLTVTNTATDTDLPANTLSYQLLTAPPNATISSSGIITWTPTEAQGPSSGVAFTTKVTDNGAPVLSATNTFTVTVNELNTAPLLSPINDQIAFAGVQLTVTNSATDVDLPANILTFSLDPGAPATAVIDPASGVFTWTPANNQVPGTNTVTVRVTDNGVPSFADTKTFRIIVASPPHIESIVSTSGNVTIGWSAIAGVNYRVEFKADLSEALWNSVSGDVMATESIATKTDNSVSGNHRFYRVVLLP